MSEMVRARDLKALKVQRNLFFFTTATLAAALGIVSVGSLLQKERIVVVPPILKSPFWIEASLASPEYIQQMGDFLIQRLLSNSATSAKDNREVLLQYVTDELAVVLRPRLVDEETRVQKEGSTYVFFPKKRLVLTSTLQDRK